jgi:hypothetical protein
VFVEFQQYFDFSLNKSCKTYLRPILPPVGRHWQLISPHGSIFSELIGNKFYSFLSHSWIVFRQVNCNSVQPKAEK